MPEEAAPPADTLGPNAWLVDEMYDRFAEDPSSVSESWQEFFAGYSPAGPAGSEAPAASAPAAATPSAGTAAAPASSAANGQTSEAADPVAAPAAGTAQTRESKDKAEAKGPTSADAPKAEPKKAPAKKDDDVPGEPLRGAAARIVENMARSLEVPTATSFREVPAKLLEVNRKVINGYLSRTRGGKVSFTHIIGYAVVRAVADTVPSDEQHLPRGPRRQAPDRCVNEHRQPRPRRRPREEGRLPHPPRPGHPRRRHGLDFRRLLGRLRGRSSARSAPTSSPPTTSPAPPSPSPTRAPSAPSSPSPA
jgi:2-oxoglutarate dehydrogenase complex dehydrogenase (E1) component-like enzyme